MWHLRRSARIVMGGLGVLTVLVGLAAWSFETEYGGNAVGGSETSNGVTRVFDIDEQSVDAEGHPVTTIVFEGTEAEANAFIERRWSEGRNYAIPVVLMAVGGILFLGAVSPPYKRKPPSESYMAGTTETLA